jgi:ubiquinone/menaquinone biosynthesis C-methylase UbiE
MPDYGLERGKVFPASKARSLLNPARRLLQSPSRTCASAGFASDAQVLELGCGPGFFSPSIAGAVGTLVLADLQSEMLHIARTRAVRSPPVQADAMTLPFRDASFDGVFIATMLGEVPDPAVCLRDVRRILRPDGVLAICETRRDSDYFTPDALRSLVEPCGFGFVERRGPRWQYVARFSPR